MKKTFKKTLSILLAVAIIFTLIAVPTSAASVVGGEYVVQEWDLDTEYSDAALTADKTTWFDEDAIGIGYHNYWDDDMTPAKRTISNGELKIELSTVANNDYFSTTNIGLRLDQALLAGQTYTFKLDMYSPEEIYAAKQYIMYMNSKANVHNEVAANKPDDDASFTSDPLLILCTASAVQLTDTYKTYSYTFIPETDIEAGAYIRVALNFRNKDADTVKTVYVKGFALSAINPNLEQKDENGKFVVQEWVLDTEYSDAALTDSKTTWFDEDAIGIGFNKYWDLTATPAKRTISNGELKIELGTVANENNFSTTNIGLRLGRKLEAGKEYTFEMDMYSPEKIFAAKQYIMYMNSKANVQNQVASNKPDNDSTFISDTLLKLCTASAFQLTDTYKTYSYTFIPETDIEAGAYIRVALNFRNKDADTVKNVYVKDMSLKLSADEYLDEYYFSDEGSRERVWSNTDTVESGFKKAGWSMIVVLQDEYLMDSTEYTVKLDAAVNFGGSCLDIYAFNEKYDGYVGKDQYDTYYNNIDNAKLIQENIASVPHVSATDERNTIKACFTTAGTDIDYSEYKYLAVVIRHTAEEDYNKVCYMDNLFLYQTIKGKAPEGLRETVVVNNYAKKLKVENDKFAKYYLKNANGTYTELSSTSGVITNLTPDTEYTIVTKWIDDGRYFASEDYSEEITFKTLKFGDINRNDKVNLIDLVAQKKALIAESVEDVDNFDMDDNGTLTAQDMVILRTTLLENFE